MGKSATSYKPEGYSNVNMMLTYPDRKCAEAMERYAVRAQRLG